MSGAPAGGAGGGRPGDTGAATSPCVNICVIHPAEGLCVGCLRSLDEIARWSRMSVPERQAVLDALPARAPRLRRRRGGRAKRTGRNGTG